MSLPEYTFVPWLQQGMARQISQVDDLGTGTNATVGRASVNVTLNLAAEAVTSGAPAPLVVPPTRTVQLLSPRDVGALKAEAILRTHPLDGVLAATPDQLAYVEFYDEDLPWRYTPASPTASKLRPWLALLVLTPEEFTVTDRGQGALPVLTLTSRAELPPVEETWAWAHAQISGTVPTIAGAAGAITAAPDASRSRLLSPRRLLPGTDYEAFLVPAFESGRLAGLRRPAEAIAAVKAQAASWGAAHHASDRQLPIYHRFRFRTALDGDFETLALKIKPQIAGQSFGKRAVDVSAPGFGLPDADGAVGAIEGALGPPPPPAPPAGQPPTPNFHAPFDRTAQTPQLLRPILDAAGELLQAPAPPNTRRDPVVVPPTYGQQHARDWQLVDATAEDDLNWLVELNLDLRSRAAAGLGATVVREHQEDYMQRAWEQVTRIEEANQRLREAELARATAESLLRKHLEPLAGDDRLAALTGPAHGGLLAAKAIRPATGTGAGTDGPAADPTVEGSLGTGWKSASVRAAVDASRVPAAAGAPAFRRIVRPERPLVKRLDGQLQRGGLQRNLIQKMDQPESAPGRVTTAPAPTPLGAGVGVTLLQTAVASAAEEIANRTPLASEVFMGAANGAVDALRAAAGSDDLTAATLAGFNAQLTPRLAPLPAGVAQAEIDQIVNGLTGLAGDTTGRVTLRLADAAFDARFSDDARGKALGLVTVLRATPPADPEATIGRLTTADDVQAFRDAFDGFAGEVTSAVPPAPAPGLGGQLSANPLLDALRPATTLVARVHAAVPLARTNPGYAPLAAIQAYPEFADPLLDPLKAISQDLVIPNISELPQDAMVVMEPNRRFIESYLAGANVAMNQELLWREYPTDQRGTPFRVFWDPLDGAPGHTDIRPMHEWVGELGEQPAAGATGMIVLVLRGQLMERYPSTVVYAQQAKFQGGAQPNVLLPRVLDPAAAPIEPVFSGRLDPDIRLVGFPLTIAQARGSRTNPIDPGYFFVFMERPGEPQFALDAASPPPALDGWDSLAWDHLTAPAGSPFVHVAENAALSVPPPAGHVAPAAGGTRNLPTWGRTSADMASILLQSPVLLARHASEMLG